MKLAAFLSSLIYKSQQVIFIILCLCLVPTTGLPCTAFVLDNSTSPVVGKNFDWSEGVGLVMVNKRGVSKVAMDNPRKPDAKLATWTSQFGSITFSWFSREMPWGGMNEAGLVIEGLGMSEGKFPEPDSRVAMNLFQWIQYQLDNFSTVEEVIASDTNIRIFQRQTTAHYLVSDREGNCASIEFIDGKMVCHTGENMPVHVLTNSTYDKTLSFLSLFQGFGGFLPIPLSSSMIKLFIIPTINSLPRFVCAADMVQQFGPQTSEPAVDYAFNILSSVAQPKRSFMSLTRWSIVYDVHNSRIYFRTDTHNKIRQINFSAFDFSCTKPVKVLNINDDLSGDVTSNFVDYTDTMNRELLKAANLNITDAEQDNFEKYIESLFCTE